MNSDRETKTNERILIWSAGLSSRVLIDILRYMEQLTGKKNIEIVGIIDRDAENVSEKYLGFPVMSPKQAKELVNNKIVISIENSVGIKKDLSTWGMQEGTDFWDGGDFIAYYVNKYSQGIEDSKRVYLGLLEKYGNGYEHKKIDRPWLITRVLIEVIITLKEKGERIGNFSPYIQYANLQSIKNPIVSERIRNCFEEEKKPYFLDNLKMLGIEREAFFNRYGNPLIIKLCENDFIHVEGDVTTLYHNPLSVFWCVQFYDLSGDNNAGLTQYVKQCILKHRVSEESGGIKRKIIAHEYPNEESFNNDIEKTFAESRYYATYDYLKGLYYLEQGDPCLAKKALNRGLEKRQFDKRICELYGDVCLLEEDYLGAIRYYARTMLEHATKEQIWMIKGDGSLNASPSVSSKIMKCIDKYSEGRTERIQECCDSLYKELCISRSKFLPMQMKMSDGRFYVEPKNSEMGIELSDNNIQIPGNWGNKGICYIRGKVVNEYSFDPEGGEYILPIQRLNDRPIEIRYGSDQAISYRDKTFNVNRLKKGEWVYLKINRRIQIESDAKFAVGKLIKKGGPKQHPGLVFNLFIDGLPYNMIKDDFQRYMPYTYDFFRKGVIFENTHAVGEWTQTNYPSMFLGVDPKRLECFQPKFQFHVSDDYVSIPQFFDRKGYECVLYADEISSIDRFFTMGPTRGYTQMYLLNKESIGECLDDLMDKIWIKKNNLFATIHCSDIHHSHFNMGSISTSEYDSEMREFSEVLSSDGYVGDVQEDFNEAYHNRKNIIYDLLKKVDFKLSSLYRLLSEYSDDDYFVSLFSDHGLFDGKNHLGREHTNTALMFRGYRVPEIETDGGSILSNMDIYSIYKEVFSEKNSYKEDSVLPEIWGGAGREYTITLWRYPGQQFEMAVNTREDTFILKTNECVKTDGRINLDQAAFWYSGGDNICSERLTYFINIMLDYCKDFDEEDI